MSKHDVAHVPVGEIIGLYAVLDGGRVDKGAQTTAEIDETLGAQWNKTKDGTIGIHIDNAEMEDRAPYARSLWETCLLPLSCLAWNTPQERQMS